MTGVRIETRIEDTAAREAFARLSDMMADTSPIMRAIGVGLVSNTHARFEREIAPDGSSWAPLNPAYAAGKRGAGILRESAMRGGLMGSITFDAGQDSVEVGSNKVYAAVHQTGATIKPRSASHLAFRLGGEAVFAKSVTIPARPYIGVSDEDEEMILDVIENAVDRASGTSGGGTSP